MRFLLTGLPLVFCAAGGAHPASPAAPAGESSVEQALASRRCPTCGTALFFAIPGITTKEDIREFAARSRLPDKEQIMADGWIHPGAYGPNGCFEVLSGALTRYREAATGYDRPSEQPTRTRCSCQPTWSP